MNRQALARGHRQNRRYKTRAARWVLFVLLATVIGDPASSQTGWTGGAIAGYAADFPNQGQWGLANAFAPNTIVQVTNLENNRSTQLTVIGRKEDRSVFIVLSPTAAQTLGINPRFAAQVRVNPIGNSSRRLDTLTEPALHPDSDINPLAEFSQEPPRVAQQAAPPAAPPRQPVPTYTPPVASQSPASKPVTPPIYSAPAQQPLTSPPLSTPPSPPPLTQASLQDRSAVPEFDPVSSSEPLPTVDRNVTLTPPASHTRQSIDLLPVSRGNRSAAANGTSAAPSVSAAPAPVAGDPAPSALPSVTSLPQPAVQQPVPGTPVPSVNGSLPAAPLDKPRTPVERLISPYNTPAVRRGAASSTAAAPSSGGEPFVSPPEPLSLSQVPYLNPDPQNPVITDAAAEAGRSGSETPLSAPEGISAESQIPYLNPSARDRAPGGESSGLRPEDPTSRPDTPVYDSALLTPPALRPEEPDVGEQPPVITESGPEPETLPTSPLVPEPEPKPDPEPEPEPEPTPEPEIAADPVDFDVHESLSNARTETSPLLPTPSQQYPDNTIDVKDDPVSPVAPPAPAPIAPVTSERLLTLEATDPRPAPSITLPEKGPESLDNNSYYLQLGAFRDLNTAEDILTQLQRESYNVFVYKNGKLRDNLNRVLVGPLNNDERGSLLTWIRSLGYPDAFSRRGDRL